MKERTTPQHVEFLKKNQIFVFGSNQSGIHGAGAAKTALKWGAIYGEAEGLQGSTYAIPTKGKKISQTLSLAEIGNYVDTFISFAKQNPQLTFLVTEIGCGLAGLFPAIVAPLFKDVITVDNIYLPETFWRILNKKDE